MKHLIHILTLLLLPVLLFAQQDSIPIDSLQTDIDEQLLAVTLEKATDTTNCTGRAVTDSLTADLIMERLCALPCVVEMSYNNVVRRFIDAYLRTPRRVAALTGLTDYYFPIFEDALHKYQMPEELKYLAIIESGLNPTAFSRAGAVGLWQFMPSTGKLYNMEINSLVDERRDVLKSTDAACRFLKYLYSVYEDWNLAIAAYNCGPGNINKAIHRSGGKRDFWEIYPYLPRETRSYLPLFIAATYVLSYADAHGICPASHNLPQQTDTLMLTDRLHLKQVADVVGVDIALLRKMNPQYSRDILPGGKAYSLCLPQELTGVFIDMQDSIYAYQADSLIHNRRKEIDLALKTGTDGSYSSNGITYYKIKQGDSLGLIAKRYHCTVAQLKKWNGLKSDNIRAGKTLKIYR